MRKSFLKIIAIIFLSWPLAIWPGAVGWGDDVLAVIPEVIIRVAVEAGMELASMILQAPFKGAFKEPPQPPWSCEGTPNINSPWPYNETICSWNRSEAPYHKIGELLKYGNWGPPMRVLKCPQECEGPAARELIGRFPYYTGLYKMYDISEIYIWRIVGGAKPPKSVMFKTGRWIQYALRHIKKKEKDDSLGSKNICETKVYVAAAGKIGTCEIFGQERQFDTTDTPKGSIVSINDDGLYRGFECHELIKGGFWSPKVSPGWYGKEGKSAKAAKP